MPRSNGPAPRNRPRARRDDLGRGLHPRNTDARRVLEKPERLAPDRPSQPRAPGLRQLPSRLDHRGQQLGRAHVGGPVPARPEQVPQPALPGQHLACALEQLHHPPIEPTATVVSTLAGGTFHRRLGLERAHPSCPTISICGRRALLADDLVLPARDTARVHTSTPVTMNSGDWWSCSRDGASNRLHRSAAALTGARDQVPISPR